MDNKGVYVITINASCNYYNSRLHDGWQEYFVNGEILSYVAFKAIDSALKYLRSEYPNGEWNEGSALYSVKDDHVLKEYFEDVTGSDNVIDELLEFSIVYCPIID